MNARIGSLLALVLVSLAGCGGAPPAAAEPPKPEVAAAPPPALEPPPPPAASAAPAASASVEPPPAAPAEPPRKRALLTRHLHHDFVLVAFGAADAACGVAPKGEEGAVLYEASMQWRTGFYDVAKHMASLMKATYTGGRWKRAPVTAGTLELRAAPVKKGEHGRLTMKLEGAAPVDEQLDVEVCADLTLK